LFSRYFQHSIIVFANYDAAEKISTQAIVLFTAKTYCGANYTTNCVVGRIAN